MASKLGMSTYCRLVNARNAVRGKKHRIMPVPGEDPALHVADDGSTKIHICRRGRHNRYKRGVMAGVERLASDYSLNLIADLRDGVFIDCGANVGELGFWARQRGFRYIAFEPEVLEARCVDLNHFGGKTECIRKALWKEETVLKFYNRADSADSSVLAGTQEEPSVTIPATTLDAAVDLSGVYGPVIFKLEAEGAEPEVLEGAARALSRIDWVAVDCGFERGPEKAHTFVETNVCLQAHGFRLVAAKFTRVTALYRRMG
ncbi:FkbM family methyltransferase [Albidovulum sp.]|uniref:FkbM family methyltransferase n=1 Tax=Albidovulum sp. TaxID=1872424 RepID=UPI0039B8920B